MPLLTALGSTHNKIKVVIKQVGARETAAAVALSPRAQLEKYCLLKCRTLSRSVDKIRPAVGRGGLSLQTLPLSVFDYRCSPSAANMASSNASKAKVQQNFVFKIEITFLL